MKLKIEMIHDIVCSWCPIGYRNIQKAISSLGIEVDFHFLPFEINPKMSDDGEFISSYFMRQQGFTRTQLVEYQESLVSTARIAGVIIDFSKRTHYYNTRNAHKLMHWAEKSNKQTQTNERLIEAYFKHGQDINNADVLVDVAEQVGIDRDSVEGVLSSSIIEQKVEFKIKRQRAFNIRSIPAFILNEHTLISGSNSVKYFEDLLLKFVDGKNLKGPIAI